ncbi:MAG: putative zinc-binding metallopeptidase, partial [Acidobacteriota bacterium]
MPASSLFDRIVATRASKTPQVPRAPRVYRCHCGGLIFFRNSVCLRCGAGLGFDPESGELFSLQPGPQPDSWVSALAASAPAPIYYRCANLHTAAGCNWLVTEPPGQQLFCRSCRLNRTIPDLSLPENAELWHRTEIAKRRLVSSLLSLNLPVDSRVNEDTQRGLAFDFLKPVPGGPAIMTGHDDGFITINIEEADDARREQVRQQLHEPYRTLLGHFRHEVGHYYWDRLVDGTPWLELFRHA